MFVNIRMNVTSKIIFSNQLVDFINYCIGNNINEKIYKKVTYDCAIATRNLEAINILTKQFGIIQLSPEIKHKTKNTKEFFDQLCIIGYDINDILKILDSHVEIFESPDSNDYIY